MAIIVDDVDDDIGDCVAEPNICAQNCFNIETLNVSTTWSNYQNTKSEK